MLHSVVISDNTAPFVASPYQFRLQLVHFMAAMTEIPSSVSILRLPRLLISEDGV